MSGETRGRGGEPDARLEIAHRREEARCEWSWVRVDGD